MSPRAPAIFIGHGSPRYAITDNPYRGAWVGLARRFEKPKAIVCISAHWETSGRFVTMSAAPRTIHDFRGFPQALFDMQYPAPGAPELAARAMALTGAKSDAGQWGFDHGAWSVLKFMYPEADVPAIQFSLDADLDPQAHYALGKILAPLREEGVLILGSGNIVHNLPLFRGGEARFDWAERFDAKVREKIAAKDHAALIDYGSLDKDALLAVPSNEHYLPLLYALAAARDGEEAEIFNTDVNGAISMTCAAMGV